MKRRHSNFFRVLLIPTILLLSIALLLQIQCRTIHSIIKESCKEIYIPNGIADTYTDLLKFSIDEHKIWEYGLNSHEKKIIEQGLNNSVWNRITDENIEEIEWFFTLNSESYLQSEISDGSYYCIYNFSLKKFVPTDDIVGHRVLFVYDKANAHYYCVSHSI